MADGDSLNEVNSDREVDADAADADIDDDDVIAARYQWGETNNLYMKFV